MDIEWSCSHNPKIVSNLFILINAEEFTLNTWTHLLECVPDYYVFWQVLHVSHKTTLLPLFKPGKNHCKYVPSTQIHKVNMKSHRLYKNDMKSFIILQLMSSYIYFLLLLVYVFSFARCISLSILTFTRSEAMSGLTRGCHLSDMFILPAGEATFRKKSKRNCRTQQVGNV